MTDFLDVDLTLDGKFANIMGLVKGTLLVPDNIVVKTIDGLRVVKITSDGFILTDGDTINSDDIVLNGGKLDLLIWLDNVIDDRLFKGRN